MSLPGIQKLLEGLPDRKVKLPQDYYDTRQTAARDLAFTVSGVARLDAIQAILDSLNSNLQAGGSFAAWQRQVAAGEIPINLPPHRVELIFRMHAQTAYAHGKCRNFEANKSARPYLMYSAINDSRTRPAHAKLDGIIRPVGDAWWRRNMPSQGFGCRCSVVALSESQAKRMGGVTDNPPDGFDAGFDHSPCSGRTEGDERALQRKEPAYHPLLRGFVAGLLAGFQAVRAMFGGGE